jgi:two-component system, chemotaxis family, sensor histidine kinase and response regulator WspE
MSATDYSDLSLMDLFRLDADAQVQALDAGLLELERDSASATQLEACMRAAHSLKGAARVVGLGVGVEVAHAMEDCFVAAQRGAVAIGRSQIDVLLRGVDLLKRIAQTPELSIPEWAGAKRLEIDVFLAALRDAIAAARDGDAAGAQAPQPGEPPPKGPRAQPGQPAAEAPPAQPGQPPAKAQPPEQRAEPPREQSRPAAQTPRPQQDDNETTERVLRVTADHLNRLLGLAGEQLVESRSFKPFADSLFRLKRLQNSAAASVSALRDALADQALTEQAESALVEAHQRIDECHQLLARQLVEMDMFDSRFTKLAHGLYDSALACRMRPFGDGVRAFPRVVRDIGRSLGKQVRLEVVGDGTPVDRDILEKLDAPLGHLLRNAVDHGIESPEERLAAGKPAEGVVRLEARHSAGRLQITAGDDGRGVDLAKVREAVVKRRLATADTVAKLSEAELLEFLFLPGFTMKEEVTELSGRGVGLDVVQTMVKQVRGTIRIFSEPGKGTRFQLQLPLTLSVVRALLVEIGGEPYAFPLAHIVRTLKLPEGQIETLEGRQHFNLNGQSIGLVSAQQVFGGGASEANGDLPVILLGDPANAYGLVADKFLGERDLVVQPLDKRLGKIKDVAAGALMEDGSPVLIVDTEDMLRSVERFVSVGRLDKVQGGEAGKTSQSRRRVLVVDDSLTVRELERKLLDSAGYEVVIAVDGMDGWNAVRAGNFDLVVTDIDMPRMDGIELVKLIKDDAKLGKLPVMIVSYKDREEDRRRGLEAGADYYLTKGSFHDDTLQQAVADLIGAANA